MAGLTTPTAPRFDHLHRLTDRLGLYEHARDDVPRREHGYCVDDAARALVVVMREPEPGPRLSALAEQYLAFCLSAQRPDGSSHNRRDCAGRWVDRPGLGDWWGRSVWALGCVAARGREPLRARAEAGLRIALQRRSPDRRGLAFAALGACDALPVQDLPGRGQQQTDMGLRSALLCLVEDAAAHLSGPSALPTATDWPWPEPRLTYANAALPDALVAAGAALRRRDLLDRGLDLLAWLLRWETLDAHLSVTPVGGRGPDDRPPGFDQQPIEVGALADACARAHGVTGDDRWLDGVRIAVRWFAGDNDAGTPMFDPLTGAGYDGMTPHGRNSNRGAEATIAAISTLQHGRRLLP